MRSPKPSTLAILLAFLLFWAFVPPVLAQGGGMTVNADYELFGTTDLNGGGHVTWTLTGDAAHSLRADIAHLFDEYPQIPRGFVFGGQSTGGNHDGVIQANEGLAYTDRLENILEGVYPNAPASGTQIGYFLLERSDLFDKDAAGGFNRSTVGIAGTTADSTASLQIKFLFNGRTNTGDVMMPLTTEAYAQSLFQMFSIEADQAGSWPVQTAATSVPGWHTVFVDPSHPSLWAGNVSTCSPGSIAGCRYDNGTQANASTFMDPALGSPGAWLDLRFASSAWATFNYTGQVAGAGDVLEFQVAPEAANLTWTTLPGAVLSVANNTSPGVWRATRFNLTDYLGQKVRLRFRFSSDTSGSAAGFFVNGFAIHAPATYTGTIVESDAHYLVGLLSFSNFNVPSGSPTLVRTPAGEILFYSGSFDASAPPPDAVRYAAFDAMENPQVLFVVMVVAAYVISWFQEAAYDSYREAHPAVYRPAVHKVKWLHWLGRIAILLLVLFYFVPTAFFVIGLRLYFNGPAFVFLALTLALSLGFGTKAYYRQMLEETPPPGLPAADAEAEGPAEDADAGESEREPIAHCTHCLRTVHEGERTYACSCGAVYHLSCASGLLRCSNCRKPIAGLERVGEARPVSMRCSSCGELQTVPEGADPRTLTCASCGGSLRHLDAGKRYLLVASNPAIAFHWLADLTKGGKPSLIVTTAAPDRLRLEFGLKGVQILQASAQAAGAVDPRKLDPAGLKAILPLAREGKAGALLYDGLEALVAASTMGDVIRFLRKANDMAFVHQITVIGRVGPGVLTEAEIERLGAEFDEVMDLSARL